MDGMKKRVIVLYASPWKMTDEKTGEIREGVSIRYLPTDNLNPCVDDINPSQKGIMAGKNSIPLSEAANIKDVPALYDMTFSMAPDSQTGKMQLKPKSISFVSCINISPVKA